MSFYDAFKDVLSVAQKADNIELYKKLLDLSAQALDLQAEIARLKEENDQLKRRKIDADRIVRHKQPYLTFSDDDQHLKYCAVCWDGEQLLIQMNEISEWSGENKKLRCHKCGNSCRPDDRL